MNLIGRYIFRETLASTMLVMAVLLLIFMSNQFAETLGDAAADVLPRDSVFRVFALQFLRYLSLLAPVGLLLGVMLALARLNRDFEMSALSAGGVGPVRLLRPIGLLSAVVAGAVAWLALFQAPAANLAIEQIRFEAQNRNEFGSLAPGRFTEIDDVTVLYAEEIDGNRLRGVFIQTESQDGVDVFVAEEGEIVMDEASGKMNLILRAGRRYVGVPGNAQLARTQFSVYSSPIDLERREFEPAIESLATAALIGADDPASRAELQWRLAAPISILVLALLAVPLCRSSPREGRYARVGLGLLIYIIYANTLSIALVWVERGVVPSWLGAWWVHAVLALFAILLLARQEGFGSARVEPRRVRYEPTG